MSRSRFATFTPHNHKYNPDFALPGSRAQYTPDKVGTMQHIFLDIAIDLESKTCAGWSIITIAPYSPSLETITMDAVDMQISTVKVNDAITPFEYDGKQIHIVLQSPLPAGKPADIAVEYRIQNPAEGMTFIAPTRHYPHKPLEMWTQGESEGSRHWYPCFDFPAQTSSTEIRVRTDARFTAVSNGELLEEREFAAGGRQLKLWHFLQKDPHPNYLVFLGIGDYAVIRDHYQTIPLRYIGSKGSEDLLKFNGQKTPRMIKFLEEKYGVEFPWVKYDQIWATNFLWGGMENTSNTVISADRGLGDRRAWLDIDFPEMVVIHELAHQWFGDLIVVKHWSHLWVKEGAATSSEFLWKEHEYGKEASDYYRLHEIREYLGNASEYQRPVVTNFYRHTTDLYDSFSYAKAGQVYHMIRVELGDQAFWKSLQTFLLDNAHQPVESIDLVRAIEKTTGRNLQPLLDQYIFSNGHPDFVVSYSWDADSSLAKITVTQKQAKKDDPDSIFDLKIPIAFGFVEKNADQKTKQKSTSSASVISHDSDAQLASTSEIQENPRHNSIVADLDTQPDSDTSTSDTTTPSTENTAEIAPQISTDVVKVRINKAEQTLYFPMGQKPDFVSFDDGNNYLKTVDLKYPVPELEQQLRHATDVIARIFAAQALAKKGGLQVLNILKEAFQTESFWGVRVEIIRGMSDIKLDQTFAAILPGLHDESPQVRRMTLSALSQFKTLASWLQVKKILEAGDDSYLVEMQSCVSLGVIAGSDLLSNDIRQETFDILLHTLNTAESWIELVRQGAIHGLSALRSLPEVVDILLEKTKPGNHTDVRRAALSAVGSLSQYHSDSVVARMIDVLDEMVADPDFMIQMGLVSALQQMYTPLAIPVLSQLAQQAVDTCIKRDAEVAITTVQKQISSHKSLVDIRKKMQKIEQENRELKSQMQDVLETVKAKDKKASAEKSAKKSTTKPTTQKSKKTSAKTVTRKSGSISARQKR